METRLDRGEASEDRGTRSQAFAILLSPLSTRDSRVPVVILPFLRVFNRWT